LQVDLETGDRIVCNVEPVEDGVLLVERDDFDAVVKDGVALRVVVGDQVGRVLHLIQAVSVTRHCELADLKNELKMLNETISLITN